MMDHDDPRGFVINPCLFRDMVMAGRIVDCRFIPPTKYQPDAKTIPGHFVMSAIPLTFDGGPVPLDWRSEGETAVAAFGRLMTTWRNTPDDFQWGDD